MKAVTHIQETPSKSFEAKVKSHQHSLTKSPHTEPDRRSLEAKPHSAMHFIGTVSAYWCDVLGESSLLSTAVHRPRASQQSFPSDTR
ncbi:hypothetical protein F441_19273 [Phytophthora nicotianae CJ01A1]|uniref:Uncharacterized protein n=1 Tax=Phytophthora nicotianae CJ01A1 TaxID=1317063 RepID=W2W0A2_PHYNI|nr:hypothetical protein F441_19273 [Phytophthora nicotianae CJ01A1]